MGMHGIVFGDFYEVSHKVRDKNSLNRQAYIFRGKFRFQGAHTNLSKLKMGEYIKGKTSFFNGHIQFY